MGHKGHWGEYTGNAKWSKDHAHTKVTKSNYKASERDDAAHIDYLKRDINYDNKHGHSDEKMTADEKHISKLAGDMKYDKEHHGSPAHNAVKNSPLHNPSVGYEHGEGALTGKVLANHIKNDAYHKRRGDGSPATHINKFMDKDHPHNKRADHDESIHSHKGKK